jgi:Asp/Glu/hydantoin racemase
LKKFKVGLIRVVTTKDDQILNAHAKILLNHFPNMEIITRCIPDQLQGIYDDVTENIAVPKIIDLARNLEREKADAIFISCAADPAVKECRGILKIPVIGAGSACASLAMGISDRIGVLGITEHAPKVFVKMLRDKMIAEIKPEGVNNTLDLLSVEGEKNTVKAAGILKEKGCDTIALACTGMSTIGIAQVLRDTLQINVIDPVVAAGFFLRYLS